MDDKRSGDECRWHELIDAVRPQSGDLSEAAFAELAARLSHDPELRKVYQRSQQFDAAVGDALHDLPVPAGAVDRLFVRLATAEADRALTNAAKESGQAVEGDAAPAATCARDAGHPAQPVRWRRTTALAMLAASVAVVAYFVFRPARIELTADEIVSSAWFFAEERGEDRLIGEHKPPAKFPSAAALAAKPTSWRPITGLLGRSQGVAYHLRSGPARATLYVVHYDSGYAAPRLVGLRTAPPPNPLTTGGQAKSVWREGDLVYVLVVEGGAPEYRAFVTPTGQLARQSSRFYGDSGDFSPPPVSLTLTAETS
jgi:hypothetical protein